MARRNARHHLLLRSGASRNRSRDHGKSHIADGRIHPARIEEMFGKAERLVNQRVQEAVAIRLHFESGTAICIPSSCARFGRLRLPYLVWPKRWLSTRWKFAYLSGVMAC